MCCSTGICGADIDQRLVNFAGDLDWLKSLGINVKRINLSQEPALFAESSLVKSVLEKSGVEGLPVIIAGDKLQSSGQYPTRGELAVMAGLTPDQIANASTADVASLGCCGGGGEAEENSTGCC
jgi:hypothetical protein